MLHIMDHSSNKRFMMAIDKHIRSRIEEELRHNPHYFTEVINAAEIMEYLKPVIIPNATREEIFCIYKNDGNTRAVRTMITQMQKFQNFGIAFLKALEYGHKHLAEDLVSGFPLHSHDNCSETSFIKALLPVTPPPYDRPPSDEPVQEQQDKISHFNSLREEPTHSSYHSSLPSSIHSEDISLSSASNSTSCDYPPPYQGLDHNLHFSNVSSYEAVCDDNSSSAINNDSIVEDENPTPRRPIPVENDENPCVPDVVVSSKHPTEWCVSGDSTDVTIPKEVASQLQSNEIESNGHLDVILPIHEDANLRITRRPIPAHDDETWMPHEPMPSDLHQSEICVSGGSGEMSFQKEIASQTQSSAAESNGERLNAIVLGASARMPTLNDSTGSTHYEREERIIANSSHYMKNYDAPKGGDIEESGHDAENTSSSDNDTAIENLWEIGVLLIAILSVAVFILKRK